MSNPEILQGKALVASQHADHLAARNTMINVADVLQSAYQSWLKTHDWSDIAVPAAVILPTAGVNLTGEINPDWLAEATAAMGSELTPNDAWKNGLGVLATASVNASLDPKYLLFGDESRLHKADKTILRCQHLVFIDANEVASLGDVAMTNVGVGDAGGYEQLNIAVAKSLQVTARLKRTWDDFYNAQTEAVEKLTRALDAQPAQGVYERDSYNPLLHTALEGMMSTGQTINAVIQPGIENAEGWTVAELAESILANHVPAILSRLVLVGDIGAQQMAGLAEYGLAEVFEEKVRIKPEAVRTLAKRQDKARVETETIDVSGVQAMQDAAYRSANRFEGCPANRAVRLMSSMMLDALRSVK